jgi:hypothetical protein
MAITFEQDDQGLINRVDRHYVSQTKRVSEEWYLNRITQIAAQIEELTALKTSVEEELELLKDTF